MTVRVGINGFGRIGRSFTRALLARGADAGVELVAVNDPMGDSHTMAFLLKHDSVGGVLPQRGSETADGFTIDGKEIIKLEEHGPGRDPVGRPRRRRRHRVDRPVHRPGDGRRHLDGGAKRVVISAPSGDADTMICFGVNDSVFDPAAHTVISNASCTTNCLAPMAKVLNDRFGIERGLITTVHAYTSDQPLQDLAKPSRSGADLRRMRAAALSIIPSSTGAATAIGLVLPELKGKLDGTSLRVPTPTGSITDLTADLDARRVGRRAQRGVRRGRADPSYRGVLEYSDEPLVSADIVGNPSSCIFSARTPWPTATR